MAAAVDRWWPDLRVWKLWLAQIFSESRCDTNAVSPVGAAGLVQLMPGTAKDLARRLNVDSNTSPHVAKFAIPAGAAYMAQLRGVWHRGREPIQAHWLAASSYNAGTKSIVSAQTACNNARMWPEISPCLESVTGAAHARETIGYVARIERYWQQFEAMR